MTLSNIRKSINAFAGKMPLVGDALTSDITQYAKNVGYALGIGSLVFAAGCGEKPRQLRVENDFVTESYMDLKSEPQTFYVAEGEPVLKDKKVRTVETHRFPATTREEAENAAMRVKRGDVISFYEGNIGSIGILSPYLPGEIPFGRDLVVTEYEIDKLRSFNDPRIVERPVATVHTEFNKGSVNQQYTIVITGQGEREAEQTVRNLQTYGIIRITEPEGDRRGERGRRVQTVPTERGLEIVAPASRLAWSDLYEFEGSGYKTRPRGRVFSDSIAQPWEPKLRF